MAFYVLNEQTQNRTSQVEDGILVMRSGAPTVPAAYKVYLPAGNYAVVVEQDMYSGNAASVPEYILAPGVHQHRFYYQVAQTANTSKITAGAPYSVNGGSAGGSNTLAIGTDALATAVVITNLSKTEYRVVLVDANGVSTLSA